MARTRSPPIRTATCISPKSSTAACRSSGRSRVRIARSSSDRSSAFRRPKISEASSLKQYQTCTTLERKGRNDRKDPASRGLLCGLCALCVHRDGRASLQGLPNFQQRRPPSRRRGDAEPFLDHLIRIQDVFSDSPKERRDELAVNRGHADLPVATLGHVEGKSRPFSQTLLEHADVVRV